MGELAGDEDNDDVVVAKLEKEHEEGRRGEGWSSPSSRAAGRGTGRRSSRHKGRRRERATGVYEVAVGGCSGAHVSGLVGVPQFRLKGESSGRSYLH